MLSPCAPHHPVATSVEPDDKLNETIQRILKELHDGKKILSDRELLKVLASRLIDGITKGYKKNITEVAWNSPDHKTLDSITNNIFQFSAAKEYQELKDLSSALSDGDKVRSFSEFKEASQSIIGKYNETWLQTEYNQAISTSQNAARWNEFQKDKKDMPFLQYQAIMDEQTRDDHAAIDGVIKHIDDDFWNIYYPPNGWGCRCEVIQLPGDGHKETADDKISLPYVPSMFKMNAGVQGIVFPAAHPYFTNMPDDAWDNLSLDVKRSVDRYYDGVMNEWIKANVTPEILKLTNFKTGTLELTKSDVREMVNHLSGAKKVLAKEVLSLLPEFKIFNPKTKPDKKLIGKFVDMNYYTVNVGKVDFIVNVGVTKHNNEKLYAIRTKEKKH